MFLESEQLDHVIDLIDGKIKPDPILVDLQNWSKMHMGIEIYDYFCEQVNGLTRLKLVVWDIETEMKLKDGIHFDKVKQAMYANAFSRFAVKYDVHKEFQDPQAIFVVTDTLKEQLRSRVVKDVKVDIEEVKNMHEDIHNIFNDYGSYIVIYKTEAQKTIHETDGLNAMISQRLDSIVATVDRYNMYSEGVSLRFISQELLDKEYGGSIINYLH